MSDDFGRKGWDWGEEKDEENDVPEERPFESTAPDWVLPPDPEEAADEHPPEPAPDWLRPPDPDQAQREPYALQVLESSTSEHRSRDPLARMFPGLPHGVRVTLDWILTIAGAILIVLALKAWVVNPYRIPSSSMEPNLRCARPAVGCTGDSSDRVLACRICLDFRAPARGDIVVFNTPRAAKNKCGEGGTFVKRVIGLPGDTVQEDDNGFIWIRGPGAKAAVKLKEPYLSSQRRLADSAHFGQSWHVPPGKYFMMGDNRAESCDSRSWGSVPRDDLIGTVFFVYWPPDRIGFR